MLYRWEHEGVVVYRSPVLDALDIPAAHLIGHSMGGMMAQTAAIEHPERVLSLGADALAQHVPR